MDERRLTKKERRALRRQEIANEQRLEYRKMTYRRVAMWVGIVIGIGVAIFGMSKLSAPSNVNEITSASLAVPVSKGEWTKGNKDSNIILVEYSDLQCSACGSFYPIVKRLSKEFEGDIQFTYRHFPLRQVHQNAQTAAQVLEAAGLQGNFWEMHDMIFENQKKWSDQKRGDVEDTFASYAESIGLDINLFRADMNSKEAKNEVEKDYQSGVQSNVNSTPTFFLNGEKIQNPRSYEGFKDIITQAIADNS